MPTDEEKRWIADQVAQTGSDAARPGDCSAHDFASVETRTGAQQDCGVKSYLIATRAVVVIGAWSFLAGQHRVQGVRKRTSSKARLTHHVVLLRRLLKGRVPQKVFDPSHIDWILY